MLDIGTEDFKKFYEFLFVYNLEKKTVPKLGIISS